MPRHRALFHAVLSLLTLGAAALCQTPQCSSLRSPGASPAGLRPHGLNTCTPMEQQQLRRNCPATPALSAALLFTSYRQTHEFEANAQLLKRCSGVLAGAAVYIFNNNPKMSASDLEERAAHFDACR
jgi:hypothetical protein